jgi:hypothetical protein
MKKGIQIMNFQMQNKDLKQKAYKWQVTFPQ